MYPELCQVLGKIQKKLRQVPALQMLTVWLGCKLTNACRTKVIYGGEAIVPLPQELATKATTEKEREKKRENEWERERKKEREKEKKEGRERGRKELKSYTIPYRNLEPDTQRKLSETSSSPSTDSQTI